PPSSRRPAVLVSLLGLSVGLGLATAAAGCSSENTKLMVTGIEPDKGDVEGGTYVRIRGNRFTADGPRSAKVYFGGRQGIVSRFESDSVLIVEAPGGKPNEVVDVLIIFDPGGQLKIPGGFHYVERNHAPPTVEDLNINKPAKDKK
ncbi:MAG TPA: IPT/TIG domain-containing protein, partial [Kofleriaceae bacterium]|nr:IPT/TIG domain-containing protein [Kofleriaceae bacterium]